MLLHSTPPTNIPTIRLISATPSVSGNSFSASPGFSSPSALDSSWGSIPPSPLLPKHDTPPKKRLVLKKKSKLTLLTAAVSRDKDKAREKEKDKAKDLSDVVRRVGVPSASASASARGFEIYVDPTDDPEIGEIVMIKKKKSRAALDAVRWGPGALGEVTNMDMNMNPDGPAKDVLKPKPEEKGDGKWWTIGRGRKDSKEKEKDKSKSTFMSTVRAKCKVFPLSV